MIRNFFIITLLVTAGCNQESQENTLFPDPVVDKINTAKGKLYIIGGGSRPKTMVQEMVDLSGIEESGYGIVLPMASEEPDSSIYYAQMQFTDLGVQNVVGMNFAAGEALDPVRVDSVRNARFIYIAGGDQRRFMDFVNETPLDEAIHQAYQEGAVIAGTSAGAAVMSRLMITGDEKRHPEYNPTFRHIQSENIIFDEGLGLVEGVIIDQHFIKRSRYNRLITAVFEHPDVLGIGIDESTAIIVEGDSARVTGESQVILLKNMEDATPKNDLMGSRNMHLEVLLPGDKFSLRK